MRDQELDGKCYEEAPKQEGYKGLLRIFVVLSNTPNQAPSLSVGSRTHRQEVTLVKKPAAPRQFHEDSQKETWGRQETKAATPSHLNRSCATTESSWLM